MKKNKVIHADDITEKDILSLYDEVLPLLYSNPKKLNAVSEINNGLRRFISFDSYHYMMDDPKPPLPDEKFSVLFARYDTTGSKRDLTVKALKDKNFEETFTNNVEQGKKKMIELAKTKYPGKPYCHYHRILSADYPKIMVGFLRFGKSDKDKAFTTEEKFIFDKLAPHIQLLFRIALTPEFNSPRFEYFDIYIDVCSRVAHYHNLSDTELKFLPEILFGRSNEEIAKKNFISVAAVKKNLRSIFKKTKTKNRIDFIGKFFTSPERMDIK